MDDINGFIDALRARAPDLRALGYRVRFELSDTGDSILLDATGGQVTVSQDPGEVAATLLLSSADLGKLMAGKLSPMLAYSLGKLKIEGSKGVAMKLASLLDE
jgi:putative sterol carrier protein